MRITMSKFKDKFHLSPEQSLIFAKKRMDENIYCGMKMENRAVTFPQTQTILNGVNVPNVQLDDIQAILNMRDAWKFLLNTVNEEVTFDYWCKLNGYIARNEALEWGKLRTGTVGISGTDYEPPVPEKEKTIEELKNILNDANASATDKALEAFSDVLYGILQKNDRLEIVGKSFFMKALFSVILFFIIDYITKNMITSTISIILVNIIILIVFDFNNVL